jgi:hypothetical protein
VRSKPPNFLATRAMASILSSEPICRRPSTRANWRRGRLHRGLALAIMTTTIGWASCAGNPPPVPVFASRADWEILAGRWRGSYTSSTPNRRGVIDFTLSAGDEQAFGDVVMFAEGTRVPYRPYPPGDPRLAHIDAAYTQVLAIKFVRAEQGQITGTIASYWDPDRNCQATATFLGKVQAHAIEGTFTSACEDGVRQLRGTWHVTRQAASSR